MSNESSTTSQINIRKPNAKVSNKSEILRNYLQYDGGSDSSEDVADYYSGRSVKAVRIA